MFCIVLKISLKFFVAVYLSGANIFSILIRTGCFSWYTTLQTRPEYKNFKNHKNVVFGFFVESVMINKISIYFY